MSPIGLPTFVEAMGGAIKVFESIKNRKEAGE
jgi:hypothetical protein